MGILPGRGQTSFNNIGGPGKARERRMERGTGTGEVAEPSGPRREVAPSWKGARRGSGSYKEGAGRRRGRALGAHTFPGDYTPQQVQQVTPPGAPGHRVRQPFIFALRLVTEVLLRTQRRSSLVLVSPRRE